MSMNLWALIAIIIVAGAYEFDHKVGGLLFAVVALAMVVALVRKQGKAPGGISWEVPVPGIS